MSSYSNKVLDRIAPAGWYKGRRIAAAQEEKLLREAGYSVSPAVVAFLQEFGGLTFRYPHAPHSSHQAVCHFNISQAIHSVFRVWVDEESRRLRTPLCLIGLMSDGDLWLTMDETGYVYASYGGVIFLLGNSGREALETLCSGENYTTAEQPRGEDDSFETEF